MRKKDILKTKSDIKNIQKNGLIGWLFSDVFSKEIFQKLFQRDNSQQYVNERDYFLQHWFDIDITCQRNRQKDGGKRSFEDRKWTDITIAGKFTQDNLDAIKSLIVSEENLKAKSESETLELYVAAEENFKARIEPELESIKIVYKEIYGKKLDEDIILNKLAEALKKTEYFINRPRDGVHTYNKSDKERLIEHIYNDRELYELTHFLYFYLYFLIYNNVPSDFSKNQRTIDDLNDFAECSIRKFGTTSKHGIMEIIRLATREENPNVIAICEYADILYYGQVDGIKQDINRAYELYKQAAGIGESNLSKNAYPLALWSVGHIIFNYDNTRVNLALPEHKSIQEIEKWSQIERIQQAYKRAKQAYIIAQIPAAANLIGQIAQLTDDDCKGINRFKKKKRIGDCKDYFEIAKNGGWVYAYNMLANEEMRQLTNEIDKKEKWNVHINNYLLNLHEAAIRNEPWAANTLGRAYLEGIKCYDPASKKVKTIVDSEGVKTIDQDGAITLHGSIDHFTIINPFNGQPEVVDSIIDPDRAFYYFKKAYEAYHIFSDRYCGWACANLKCYFSDRLSEEELRDIETIIEKYSHIEPGILKSANEKRQLPTTGYAKKLK